MEVSVPFHISSPALLLMYITTVVVICATLSQTADFFLKFLSSVTFCIELCSSIPPVTPAAMAMGLTIAHCTSKTLPCCTTRLAHQQKSYFGVWTNSTEGYWYREPPEPQFCIEQSQLCSSKQRGGQSSLQTANPNINSSFFSYSHVATIWYTEFAIKYITILLLMWVRAETTCITNTALIPQE